MHLLRRVGLCLVVKQKRAACPTPLRRVRAATIPALQECAHKVWLTTCPTRQVRTAGLAAGRR